MVVARTLILGKELLLSINYYKDGSYSFHTKLYEFYAASDNAYPECPNLNTEIA